MSENVMKMDEMTIKTKTIIESLISAKMPIMLVGSPGTGKTASVKAIAKERGYKLITLVGSRMDPTDVSGLPKAATLGEDENNQTIEATVYLSPYWQVEILRHKKVILFLDEFSNSSGAIQAAFLTILQDREFPNGHKFPDETIIIGAMNPPEEAADGYELSLPTTNRIAWISWSPTMHSWIEGMKCAWGEDVPKEELEWKIKIANFIKDNPTWLHQQPKDTGTTAAVGVNASDPSEMAVFRSAWPSRRSWDNLSRALAGSPEDNFIRDSLAQSIVGFAAAADFREWIQKNDFIKPEDVLADPSIVDWKNISLSDSNILMRAISKMIDANNSTAVLLVVKSAIDADRADLIASYTKDIFQNALKMPEDPAVKRKNRELATTLIPALKRATPNKD